MIEDFYDSSALVEQVGTSSTPMGGSKKTYSTRISALACRVSSKNIRESDEFGKMSIRAVWILYCAASTANKAIEESDRVTVGGTVFEITGIGNPALRDHHLEINMREIR